MKKTYYSMTRSDQEANINIYGDISSYPWEDCAMNVKALSKALDELSDVSKINVYINSYGGEVAEGLAIYNALKRHNAKVVTYCDGFAASIASVIFMAGDERIMNESSLLMIHNAWSWGEGNADQLRKQADDLDKITQASVIAYKAHSTLTEEQIKALMDAETWILPDEAIEYGFATSVEKTETSKASQNVRKNLFEMIKMHSKSAVADEDDPEDEEDENADDNSDEDEKSPEDDSDDPEDDPEKEENKTTQMLSGLFNAILKM